MSASKWFVASLSAAVLAGAAGAARSQAPAAAAAEALLRKSGCYKCHAVEAKKDGPSYKEVAAKYKGKPDAEQKVRTHVTTNPKVKVDGQEEEHASLKTKNDAEIGNVVRWILSR